MDSTVKNPDELAAERPVKKMAIPSDSTSRRPMGLDDDEDHGGLLTAIGAALLINWNDVPQDIQRSIFAQASDVMTTDHSSTLREELARFIHDHKDDDLET